MGGSGKNKVPARLVTAQLHVALYCLSPSAATIRTVGTIEWRTERWKRLEMTAI